MDYVTFTRRTEDPKLAWLETQLANAGISSKREGASFHAPILKVPRDQLDAAQAILDPVDDIDDDDARFGCSSCGELPDRVTCNSCGNSWCERCDPAPSALCHHCHGRGFSTAPIGKPWRDYLTDRLNSGVTAKEAIDLTEESFPDAPRCEMIELVNLGRFEADLDAYKESGDEAENSDCCL